jgi:hypothetical protein
VGGYGTAGAHPDFVAVGDFNGDGRPDLAVTNQGDNNLAILLGNAAGAFATAVTYVTGATPTSVAVGDVNGDGRSDLAVSNYGGLGTVTFFTGNPDGTLQAVANQVVGAGTYSLALADFNGDGTPDLASANYGSGSVSVLLGNSTLGTFLPAVNYNPANSPLAAVATSDFNADGFSDWVVVAASGSIQGRYGPDFQAGGFGQVSGGATPSAIAVGDFNGDGRPDLAVANSGSGTISILLSSGGSVFLPPVNYTVGAGPSSIAVEDLDGTPGLDLAVANRDSSTVSTLVGNGNGTFRPAVNYQAGNLPLSVAVLNNEGDLVVANDWAGGTDPPGISILRNNREGQYQAGGFYTDGGFPTFVAVRDFNGDGWPDLAVPNYGGNQGGDVSILLGNPDGTFRLTADRLPLGEYHHPRCIAVGDFNGDARPDLAVVLRGARFV